MASDESGTRVQQVGETDLCNVCGGDETDHHYVEFIERVAGASIWVYRDRFVKVVPDLTPSSLLGGDRHA